MAPALKALLRTDDSWFNLVARVALGAVMFPHGAQKLLGWFGGFGLSATAGAFAGKLGIPVSVTFLVVLAEFFGALMLVAGAGTRLAALGLTLVMVGALVVHAPNGFFMDWGSKHAGEGFEYHLLALALSGPLLALGGGRWSVDGWLLSRKA